MKRHICSIGLLACLGASLSLPASAAPKPSAAPYHDNAASIHVVAVVGDQVISSRDLEDRMQLVLVSTGLNDTPEVRQKLLPQVVHILVDETLQLQEAARNGISANEQDIKQAIAILEQRNGKEPGSLEQNLEEAHISKLPFYAQLRAQIVWNKLLVKKVRSHVRVSDEEVERASRKAAATPQVDQVQISAIRLPVDSPKAEAGVKALAEKLAGEIKGGTSFDAVAQPFASGGGGQAVDRVWVSQSEIDPAIAAALKDLAPGGVTPPIKTQSGYQIIKLVDRRAATNSTAASGTIPEAEMAIRQITLTLKPDAKKEEAGLMLNIAREVAKNAGTCFDKNIAGIENLADMDIKVTYVRQLLSKLAPELRQIIEKLPVAGVSEPYASPAGIELYMLCERIDMPPIPATADESEKIRIRGTLLSEKMDLEAQKYMRNLRRDAFVDVRL